MHWIWIWLLSFLITLCYMWNKWLINVIHKNILSKLQQLHRIKYGGITNHILYIQGRWFTPHKHFSTYNDHTPKQKMRECVIPRHEDRPEVYHFFDKYIFLKLVILYFNKSLHSQLQKLIFPAISKSIFKEMTPW